MGRFQDRHPTPEEGVIEYESGARGKISVKHEQCGPADTKKG